MHRHSGRLLNVGQSPLIVGWPGALQPPAPTDPGVKVSLHRALLIRPLANSPEPTSIG